MPPPSSQRRFVRMTPLAILLSLLSLAAAQNIRAGSDPVPLLLAAASGIRPCYSFDGKGNNINNPDWGSVGEELIRPEGNSYQGSWHFPRKGPNARTVSNVMSHQTCTESDRTAETCINDWYVFVESPSELLHPASSLLYTTFLLTHSVISFPLGSGCGAR